MLGCNFESANLDGFAATSGSVPVLEGDVGAERRFGPTPPDIEHVMTLSDPPYGQEYPRPMEAL
jgi:hypothetical protein